VRKSVEKWIGILLCLALAVSLLPATARAVSAPVVTGYEVTSTGAAPVAQINRGNVVYITITVKDTGTLHGAVTAAGIDVIRLVDSFSGGSIDDGVLPTPTANTVEILSTDPAKPVEFRFRVAAVTYSGIGNTLKLKIGVLGTYTDIDLTLNECREYSEPTPGPVDPYIYPAPTVEITRGNMDPVKAGDSFTLTLTITNKTGPWMRSPKVTFAPSEAFLVNEASMSKTTEDISTGKSVKVTMNFKALADIQNPSQYVDVTVSFLYNDGSSDVRGEASERILIPVTASSAAAGAPVLQVSSSGLPASLAAGQEATVTVTVKNAGQTAAENPIAFLTASESLMLMDGSSRTLETIEPGGSRTFTVKIQAKSAIADPAQSLTVELKYSYAGTEQASASETVWVPSTVTGDPGAANAPVLQISGSGVSDIVKANKEYTLTVTVKNAGQTAVESPIVFLTASNALMLMDGSSRTLETIEPGGSRTFTVKLKVKGTVTDPAQSVQVEVKYSYAGSGKTEQTSVSETIWVPAAVTDGGGETPSVPVEGATPNVIISQYSYGEDAQVAAGSVFALEMLFRNTSAKFRVENIVMTIATGEGLAISSSSNTMYYSALAAGGEQEEVIEIQVLPAAKTGSASIDVSFSYEYVDNHQRHKVTTNQSIAIPVYQPDRLEIEDPMVPDYVTAYEEIYISLQYVNKGKSEVSNVRAEIVSEDGTVTSINPIQNLGNFASGSSGTIDFILTPTMSGEVSFTFRITYEDPNAQEKVKEFPVTLMVEEPWYPEPDYPIWPDEPGVEDEGGGIPWWVWVVGGAVIVAAVVVTIVLVRKKRKPAVLSADTFDWGDDQ